MTLVLEVNHFSEKGNHLKSKETSRSFTYWKLYLCWNKLDMRVIITQFTNMTHFSVIAVWILDSHGGNRMQNGNKSSNLPVSWRLLNVFVEYHLNIKHTIINGATVCIHCRISVSAIWASIWQTHLDTRSCCLCKHIWVFWRGSSAGAGAYG